MAGAPHATASVSGRFLKSPVPRERGARKKSQAPVLNAITIRKIG